MPIKQLSPDVFNQIAAGEVVERPSSIVKELLENALDAHAHTIEIDIENGGIDGIRIHDDGVGICKEELQLALMPHATSKISSIDDLEKIASFGFRGEALASISSVCLFKLSSKTSKQKHAYTINNHQGEFYEPQPIAHLNGTTIECRNLFYNIPVRRKFLKQAKTEFLHIEAVVKRVALAHENTSFVLRHNSRVVLQLKATGTSDTMLVRLKKLFGRGFVENSLPVNKSVNGMKLSGWISSPVFLRGQSDLQYLYVNQRMVRDKLINQVIRKVYEPILYPGKVPSYLLYFSLSSADVDVNVHPAKSEVRFQSPKDVHDFIYSALQEALSVDESVEENPSSDNTGTKLFVDSSQSLQAKDSINSAPFISSGGEAFPSLISLGRDLALLLDGEKTHLFDVKTMYGLWLKQHLSSRLKDNDIVSRVVLVPLTVELAEAAIDSYPFQLANQLGFELSRFMENKLIVRKVPALLTHLDVCLSVKEIAQATDLNSAIDILTRHQHVALEMLSDEEKRLLTSFIRATHQSSARHRILSEKELEEVLHG